MVLIATCAAPISAQDTKSLNGMGTANRAGFINSNETATLDCAGGTAAILGDNNTLTINGACSALELMGSGNKITISFAAGSKIDFVGSNNRILWTSSDGKEPRVNYVGSNNTMSKGS